MDEDKRIKSENRPVPRWLIAAITPFALTFAFLHVLFRDTGRAFRFAWLEVGIELESIRRAWRR